MKIFLALFKSNLRLSLRDRSVIFFGYLFPLLFFFAFAEFFGDARASGAISHILSTVLVLGILGNGLWGAGMRAVADREQNILRRFKVTPIGPAPILLASLTTGWLLYLPSFLLLLAISNVMYKMPLPQRSVSLFVIMTLGVMAMRAIGLILASVVNTMAEINIAIQLLYMPMLFLSGITIPLAILPDWAQIVAQFLPASYLVSGFEGILLRRETLLDNWQPAMALLVSSCVAVFISIQVFRWEKGERIRRSAKLWLLVALAPFVLLGSWEIRSKGQVQKSKALFRELRRNESTLFHGGRIFTGDGRVIENGGVLVRMGKIEQIFEQNPPEAKSIDAEGVDASGKTLMPGLIDTHVHLGATGGFSSDDPAMPQPRAQHRELAAYLYSGVTAVRSVGDALDSSIQLRGDIRDSRWLGAELFACGPLFTAEGGHGTEYLRNAPAIAREGMKAQFLRIPASEEQAREMVRGLKNSGVDCIKLVLETGTPGMVFQSMTPSLAIATGLEARRLGLPVAVHTGDPGDVETALTLGASSIEHGSFRSEISEALWKQAASAGIAYAPTLSPLEGILQMREGRPELLNRSLVQQVGPAKLLASTRQWIAEKKVPAMPGMGADPLLILRKNLLAAHRAGVMLVTGSDAGNPLVIHGPTVQRELELWVAAGIPPRDALRAATWNAARLLGASNRIGRIAPGYDANLVLVDGDPLSDIAAAGRISMVMYRGERIRRQELFEQK